jgi:hypothetical protein
MLPLPQLGRLTAVYPFHPQDLKGVLRDTALGLHPDQCAVLRFFRTISDDHGKVGLPLGKIDMG